MSARVVWKGPALKARTLSAVKTNFNRAGDLAVAELRKAVSTPFPPASRPGKPPHKRTGKLLRSIKREFSPATLTLYVGSIVKYAGLLERGTKTMKARPWLFPTFRRIKSRVGRIAAGGK